MLTPPLAQPSSDLDTGTYSGVASGFRLYNSGTEGGAPNDLFGNNVTISSVPEPSGFVISAIALAGMGLYRRRKNRKAQESV